MHAIEFWTSYKNVTEIAKIYKKLFEEASVNEENEERFTTLNRDRGLHVG